VLSVVVDVAQAGAKSATITTRAMASGTPLDAVQIHVKAKD